MAKETAPLNGASLAANHISKLLQKNKTGFQQWKFAMARIVQTGSCSYFVLTRVKE